MYVSTVVEIKRVIKVITIQPLKLHVPFLSSLFIFSIEFFFFRWQESIKKMEKYIHKNKYNNESEQIIEFICQLLIKLFTFNSRYRLVI